MMKLPDISLYLCSHKSSLLSIKCLKWENWLLLYLTISFLDVKGTFHYLQVKLDMTDTYQWYFVWAFLDFGTTGSFINKKFVQMHQTNTWKISWPITMFNIYRTTNEASQILEVVNMVLWYKTYSEQMLLAVSSLDKQDLILKFSWLKYYNPEVNWKKEKVEITCCPPRYSSY